MEGDRLVAAQPYQFSAGVYNIRKLIELPYHQTLAGVPEKYNSTLYLHEYIFKDFFKLF